MARIAPIVQSSVLMQPSAFATTIPVAAASGSGQLGSVAPTILVEVPTLEDTKAAFQEVSLTFQDMSAQHGQIQGNLQELASTVQALRQSKQEEQQTSVQVQETLKMYCICGERIGNAHRRTICDAGIVDDDRRKGTADW